jgi:hypothetical protein
VADSAWVGVAGALGGVALTGAVGLGTATLAQRWDKASRRLNREQESIDQRDSLRRESYVSYLGKAAGLQSGLLSLAIDKTLPAAERERQTWELVGAQLIEYQASLRTAKLVAGDAVVEALGSYDEWVGEQAGKVIQGDQASAFADGSDQERTVLDAMRRELSQGLAA